VYMNLGLCTSLTAVLSSAASLFVVMGLLNFWLACCLSMHPDHGGAAGAAAATEAAVTVAAEVCDYSVGEWVADPVHHPLYSGKHCSLWLSPLWSCRQNNRPDLGYESFRWQPAPTAHGQCALAPFRPHNFLQRY